jgi:hypothetical protein
VNTTTIGTKNLGGTTIAPRAPGSGSTWRRRKRESTRRRTSTAERRAIYAVAVAAGVLAVFSPAQPAAYESASAVLRFAFAAGVTLAASRARRWTWLIVGGLAVLGSDQGLWLAVAGAGILVALAATVLPRRRLPGAISVGLSLQALLHLPPLDLPAGSVAVVLVAITPVLVSAYLVSPRRVRRRIHRAALAGGAVVLVSAAILALSSYLAYSSANKGAQKAKDGLSAARAGKTVDAARALDESADLFAQANGFFTAPWAQPALVVPLVAQQADALATVTAEGEQVALAAAGAARSIDYEALKYRDGRIDVTAIRAAQAPLAATASGLEQAEAAIDDIRSPWLAGPLAAKVDEFDREVRKALPEAQTAALAAQQAPGLLGADGPRRYFVAFTTPAEERGLGGFMGSWAILTAEDGKVDMTVHGRARDINEATGGRDLTGPEDYVARYGRFRPQDYVQDVTFSPDLPTVAQVVNQLYPPRVGPGVDNAPLDGLLVVDPYGLAALLELTGPVQVEGLAEPLTSANAADVLLRRQYLELGGTPERRDALDDASRETFDKLVDADLPAPGRLADLLAPVVADKHIMFHSFTGSENDLMRRVGADGAFPQPDGGDLLSVRSQNAGNNKADIFLQRKVEYRPRFDPATGATEATLKVTLTNESPSTGLPEAFLGSNDRGLPPGTNQLYFSVYSPLGLRQAKIDGAESGFEFQEELGSSVYSRFLTIPPGGTVTVEMDLFGALDPGRYRLALEAQPMVNPDQVLVELEPTEGWGVRSASAGNRGGFAPEGSSRAVLAAPLTGDYELEARFRER